MGKAHASLVALAASEGLVVLLSAMRANPSALRLQWRACQALWHITDGATGARAAQALDTAELLSSAMMRFPYEKALQLAACAALANIAKRTGDDTVLNVFL